MTTLWAFVKLSRPHFLLGGALMFAVGVFSVEMSSAAGYVLGQIMVTSAQLTAHYVNEYADIEADRGVTNRTAFSGGSGVLSGGRLAPAVALRAARFTSVIAIVCAGVIVEISVTAAILGLVALAVSWTYSMPPLRLLDSGYGELLTSAVVTVAVPIVGSLVQGEDVSSGLVLAMAVLFPTHLAMMLCFELPDLDTDRESGKTVLAVRMGPMPTVRLITALFAAPLAALSLLAVTGPAAAELLLVGLVGLIPASVAIWASVRQSYHWLTGSAVATLVTLASGFLVVSL